MNNWNAPFPLKIEDQIEKHFRYPTMMLPLLITSFNNPDNWKSAYSILIRSFFFLLLVFLRWTLGAEPVEALLSRSESLSSEFSSSLRCVSHDDLPKKSYSISLIYNLSNAIKLMFYDEFKIEKSKRRLHRKYLFDIFLIMFGSDLNLYHFWL